MPSDPSMLQTAAGLSTTQGISSDLDYSEKEKEILRTLAGKVADLAGKSMEKEKARLWTNLNDLNGSRPMIFCDPENGWNEIVTQDQIECEKPLFRVWEMHLRKEIFWGTEMKDDRVIEPYFNVPYNYEDTGWGIHETKVGGDHGGSYTWVPPIKDYDADFSGMKFPEIRVDYEMTERIVRVAETILGDILPVRLRGIWWWTLGMTWDFINLRGLQNFMMDLYDKPEWVHRMMAFMRDGHLNKLKFLEENGLLALNTEGSYVGSGGFGWTTQLPQAGFNPEKVRAVDMWGFAESQETVGVDPEMFGEFIYPYQKPILERFGLNCYGCCEPVDSRWHIIKDIPRLRRVSTSPWADREKMRDLLGPNFLVSLKPSPTPLAQKSMNEELVRSELRKDLEILKDCHVEVLMKDNNTLGGSKLNAVRWCQIAREEIDRLY